MRSYHYIFTLLILSSYTCVSQSWNLIWQDEFNGSSLDNSKWVHDIGTGSQYGIWGWGNGELQYYQPQNTTLDSGIATITVKEEPNGIIDSWGNASYFSSSKITTKGIFDFRYGKVEARIKTIDGQGFWPAFWMLPTGGSWPCDGEIDIMEQWGNNSLTNSTTGAAHLGTCPYSLSTHFYETSSSYISSGSYADDFHTYSVIWKEDTITWYVDETVLFSLNPSSYWSIPSQSAWPFNANEWYLMINLAITQAGPNSNTVFPNQMEIDYVRVYQEDTLGFSGCTDSIACNYNTTANVDDGSCVLPDGCTDSLYLEYDANAQCDNGSCITLIVNGCTDSIACNYNTTANVDDGSCVLPDGCTDSLYLEYDANAQCDNGSCITLIVNGCTDSIACNYNATANSDDGSCVLPDGCTDSLYLEYDANAQCDNGSCITLIVNGCTDSIACNYNATANSDDGSCVLPDGCTDSLYLEYDANAQCDNGSCITLIVNGCTDSIACNYNATANVEDGSCAFNSSSSNTYIACDSYFWNGIQYSNTGIYAYLTYNAVGCDSTATLDLTINNTPNTSIILGVENVNYLQTETYSVAQNINATFEWVLNSSGIIISGMNTNSAQIQWGNNSGIFELYVIETIPPDCSDTSFIGINVSSSTSIDEFTSRKELLKVTDLLGREIKAKRNSLLLYIYDDGTVEMKIILE